MADPFATPDDLAVRWRPLSPTEIDTAAALLDDASLRLRAEYPGLDDNVTNGSVDPGVLRAVAVAMVKRAMIGGSAAGMTQQSEGMGPFSHSSSFANPLGNLFITAEEDRFIRGYQPGAQSVGYGNDTTHSENVGTGYVYGVWM